MTKNGSQTVEEVSIVEGKIKNQNPYVEYEDVETVIQDFKVCVRYIAEFSTCISNCNQKRSELDYEDELDELWEMIGFMLVDETFNELFPEDVYDFIDRTMDEAGLSLRHDFHRIFDDR